MFEPMFNEYLEYQGEDDEGLFLKNIESPTTSKQNSNAEYQKLFRQTAAGRYAELIRRVSGKSIIQFNQEAEKKEKKKIVMPRKMETFVPKKAARNDARRFTLLATQS